MSQKSTQHTSPKIGIILLNMGGPVKQEDVRPFLYNLFSDRDIISLGAPFMQKTLAWLIAKRRAPKSMVNYQKIGGGSPLQKITLEQAKALEEHLSDKGDFVVTMAMRYWDPYADEALDYLMEQGVEKIIALTLYPHYSKATTGSSLKHLRQAIKKKNISIPVYEIDSWPKHPPYIEALGKNIIETLKQFSHTDIALVYSAHSLPESFIKEGDPYLEHTRQTLKALDKLIGKKGYLCFQSRSGPVNWLEPSTPDMLQTLANQGFKDIAMVPISFVSDHIETLYEIDMLYKDMAKDLGMNLVSCPSLNTQEDFIAALGDLLLEKLNQEGK